MSNYNIIQVEIEKIIVTPERQRRELGDLTDLKHSIAKRGVMEPVLITRDNELIMGCRRLTSCKELGLTFIPAVYRDEVDPLDLQEMELEENICRKDLEDTEKADAIAKVHAMQVKKYGFAAGGKGWSQEDTADKLAMSTGKVSMYLAVAKARLESPVVAQTLKKQGVVAAFKVMQSVKQDQVMKIMNQRAVQKVESTPADPTIYYQLGNCLDLIKAVPDNSIDLVFTDPPFGVAVDKMNYWGSLLAHKITYDDSHASIMATLDALLPEILRVSKPDSFIFLWTAFSMFEEFKSLLIKHGYNVCKVPFFWCKDVESSYTPDPDHAFAQAVEFGVYGYRGSSRLNYRGRINYMIAPLPKHNKLHPHEKSILLQQWLIESFCMPGAHVLDPFAGSGSSIKAALNVKTVPLGFEMDETYYNTGAVALASFLERMKNVPTSS